MERDEIAKLLGGETASFEHNVMIWIPSFRELKDDRGPPTREPLGAAEVRRWTLLFINLMTALFGGATAYGIRNPGLSEALHEATGRPREQVFRAMATLEGGDLPEERKTEFDKRFAPLKAAVSANKVFSEQDLNLLADPEILREPVTLVESFAADANLRENLEVLKILLLQMGKETDQIEVAILVDDTFYKLPIS